MNNFHFHQSSLAQEELCTCFSNSTPVHRMVVVHGCSTTQCKLQFIIVFAIADVQIHYDIQIGYRERIWSVNYVINFSKVARCFGSKWAFFSCNCFVPAKEEGPLGRAKCLSTFEYLVAPQTKTFLQHHSIAPYGLFPCVENAWELQMWWYSCQSQVSPDQLINSCMAREAALTLLACSWVHATQAGPPLLHTHHSAPQTKDKLENYTW